MLLMFSINLNTVSNVKGNYAWSSSWRAINRAIWRSQYLSLLQIATQRESQNILEYSRLEYVIVAQLNPRVVKAQTIYVTHTWGQAG